MIDPQADDDDVIGPAFRRSSCRSVPMNALLTCLSRTTSPGNGRASGLELERCCAAAEKPSGRSALVAHVYDGCAELTPYGQELANVGLGIRVVALSPRGVVESLLHGHAAGRSCRDQRNCPEFALDACQPGGADPSDPTERRACQADSANTAVIGVQMTRSGHDGEMPFTTAPTPMSPATPVRTRRRSCVGMRSLTTARARPE